MDAQDKANELVRKFSLGGWAKENAKLCVEEILMDLNESLDIAKDFHPHAKGLISGSLSFWYKVKSELETINCEDHDE